MEKTYQPDAIEQRWYRHWEKHGYFKPALHQDKDPYCIMIPPPNVTGSLHMGHGFNNTIMDALVRFHRMQGRDTLWQPGTDHAGIATQMVVERQMAAEGLSRHDLGREKFLERVWQWKAQSGGTITGQIRRLGSSVDWSRERFTMDEGLSRAVVEAFVQLHEKGLIYRGKRLVNWDPAMHTAISDLEVLQEEEQGSMWHLSYPLADGHGHLVVATTRPETMLGDTAVAVHPEDERYRHLVGRQIRLPITDRLIPVIADEYVDREFGTGCVKITPAHDFNDYEVGKRHDLPLINLFDQNAHLLDRFEVSSYGEDQPAQSTSAATEPCPEGYAGLSREQARKRIVDELLASGALVKTERHRLKVPRGDRSGVIIEPWLTNQWYISMDALARPAIEAVETGKIQFVPKQYENMYFAWLRDIQDWCISRQLWWGHRIPAWYAEDGRVFVGRSEQEVRQANHLGAELSLHQDEDVLDTWFSSSLWTFSTLGWPDHTAELQKFHPTNVLVTGFDIIFFWVARMIMMTMHLVRDEAGTPQIPFRTVYVHGLVRDSEGQKMSKSKGNVLDPLDIVDGINLEDLIGKRTSGLMQPAMSQRIAEKTRKEFPEGIQAYGTDALRFTFCSLATTGRDINFDMGRVEGYRNFCNKIWNAARFVLMHTEEQDCGQNGGEVELGLADRWIISSLQRVEAETCRHFEQYRFDLASQALYEFVWNQYCDWYLELVKPILNLEDASPALLAGTRRTMVRVLETVLRLVHPIMPFISEEIWQRIRDLAGREGDSIMLQPYPQADTHRMDVDAEAEVSWLQHFIQAVRNIRAEMDISPGKPLDVHLRGGSAEDRRRVAACDLLLRRVGRLNDLTWLDVEDGPAPVQEAPSAVQWVGDLEIRVPMAGLIDRAAELARISRERDRAQDEEQRLVAKLANEKFRARAPAAIVQKEEQKLSAVRLALQQFDEQKKTLESL